MPKTYTGSAERGEILTEPRQDAEDHGGGLAEPQQNLRGSRRNSDRTPARLAPRTPGAPKDHKHQKYSPRLRNAKTHSAGPKTPKKVSRTPSADTKIQKPPRKLPNYQNHLENLQEHSELGTPSGRTSSGLQRF